MKNFPFKTLFACIFFPPVLYIFTISALEIYFQNHLTNRINSIMIQNSAALLEGRYSVKEEVSRNLGKFLSDWEFEYKAGVSLNILVKTKNDIILYPSQYEDHSNAISEGNRIHSANYIETAEENYSILNQGLVPSINVRIRHNSWLSNCILVFYILLALFLLRISLKRSFAEADRIQDLQINALKGLTEKLAGAEVELEDIKKREDKYRTDINELSKEKENLSTDIDALLDEMEGLEKGLNTQKDLRKKSEDEIEQLKNEIEGLKNKIHKPRKRDKKTELMDKRFKVLYKNLVFTEKAIEGFISLSDEFQLKAEEIIQRLDSDDTKVSVKRKVFSKGGKINVLEIDFAYSGRLYYQKDSRTKNRIVAIGTKNTQTQDLAFLEREYN